MYYRERETDRDYALAYTENLKKDAAARLAKNAEYNKKRKAKNEPQ